MIALVDLAEAKRHLRRTDNDADLDINDKILHASSIVLRFCKLNVGSPAALPWAVVPAEYKAFTLAVLGELWLNRESSTGDILPDKLVKAFSYLRVPTIA